MSTFNKGAEMGNQQESLLSTPPETTVGGKMLKEIHTTENYLVDTDGEIYNAKTLKKKAQFVDKNGYKTVDIYVNNKCTRYRVHRFVAIAFIDNPYNKPCVNHKDGNKQNNKVDNLEWVTYSENTIHAFENNLMSAKRGQDSNLATLTDEEVHKICQALQDGLRNKEIRKLYGVSKDALEFIRYRKTWVHISCNYTFAHRPDILSEDTVRWICEKLEDGMRICDIVRLANNPRIDKTRVRLIKIRKSFKDIVKDYKF